MPELRQSPKSTSAWGGLGISPPSAPESIPKRQAAFYPQQLPRSGAACFGHRDIKPRLRFHQRWEVIEYLKQVQSIALGDACPPNYISCRDSAAGEAGLTRPVGAEHIGLCTPLTAVVSQQEPSRVAAGVPRKPPQHPGWSPMQDILQNLQIPTSDIQKFNQT